MEGTIDPSADGCPSGDQAAESESRGGNPQDLAEGVQIVDGYPINEDDGLYPQVLEGDYEEEDSISGANEEDEAINLADILSARDSCLTEEELWALCRECCLVLEVVNSSPEMFQTLCITPDTVAFDTVGNVCFLDLGSAPEPLYIPPEYNNEGNSYKSHLFSLGMTLLYAAEYNTDQEQTELNPELHDLLGCMTSEKVENRPDLENVITQCEEELVGKSSQDICAAIGQFVAGYSPAPPDLSCVSLADVTESLAEYLQTQSSLISDSRSDGHSNIHLANPQEHSTPLLSSKHKHYEQTSDPESGDMPSRGLHMGIPQPTGNRGVPSRPSPRKTPRGGSVNSNTHDFVYNNNNNEMEKPKPPLPRKPESFRNKEKRSEDDSGVMADTGILSEIDTPTKHNKSHDTSMTRQQHDSPSTASVSSAVDDSVGNSEYRAKRSKRRQGVTICEILDVVERYLGEEELWALLKEGNIALKRKRKHLPAYISPDTLLLRENGTLSFKAIPEDKPLETMFMSPELQQKGQLTEKTCLYGLSITMKCAGGNKHSTSMEELNMSGDLTTLLTSMVDPDPMCRPTFDEVSELVGEQERDMGGSFINTNQLLFQEAYIKLLDHHVPEIPKETPPKIKDPPKDENANMSDGSAFRSVNGSSLINPSSAFKPIVPGKMESESSLPSAFVSSATHFKPIVIHQSNSPEKGTKTLTNTASAADNDTNDKDKEVVRKLKELKQNLMKHRQAEIKSNENDEKSSSSKSSQDGGIKRPIPAARLKPTKSHENLHHDKMSVASDSKSESGGALESLLSEIQKQGAVPDTNSLASAIAGYLQNHLSQNESKSPSASSNFADGQSQGFQGQFNSMQNQEQGNFSPQNINPAMMNFAAQLPNLNIPMQYHQQLQGQTFTMPMSPQQQYGGGMLPGYPLQVQLQTDPRTGFIQLVPVGPMGPPPSIYSQGNADENSDSRSVHSSKSPKPSSADNSAILNTSFSSSKSRGRTARDLVQKTANIRHRNNTPGASAPKMESDTNLWRSKSAHALDQTGKIDSSQNAALSIKRQVYDDTAIQMNRGTASGVYNLHPPKHFNQRADNMINVARLGNGYQYYMNPPRTRSQSSSPSPSKDSGVSGMNMGYKPPPPGSLMERLLNSNATGGLKQQQRLGLVVHLLREEFAFDGYMENGVEDLAMAEYIGSLGNLKWETFASAITEKYSDLYWSSELLCNLYEVVNGARPEGNPRLPANKKPKEADNMSMRTEDMEVKLPGLEDQNLSSSSLSDKSGQQPVRKRGHNEVTHQTSAMKPSHPARGKQIESSDSDQDNFDRRNRRYRRKIQERASKGASGSHMQNMNSTYTVSSADNRSLEIPPRIHQVQRIGGDKIPIEDGGVIPANDIRDSWQGNSLPQANHYSDPNSLVNANEVPSSQQGHVDSPTTLPIQRQNAWAEGSSQRDTPPSPNVMSLDRQNKRESPRGTSRQVSLSNLIPESQQKSSQGHYTPQKPPRGMLVHKNSDNRGSHPQLNNAGQKQVNLARAGSGSSHSSSVSGTVVTRHLSQASLTDQVTLRPDVTGIKKRRCHILYHGATIQLNISQEIEKFMQDLDEDNPEYLSAQLAAIQQQLAMERKQRRKSQNFYNKLQDTPRPTKGEQKNTVTQVSKDLDEMTQKVRFLDLCRSHIEMLQAELHGIHCSYLNSIATCPRGQPLILKPCQENPLLQFQVFREPQSGCDLLTLQAGTAEGLMSHLFAYTALSDGYMHQFLFCFRYFAKPVQVLSFLINTYKSATQTSGAKDTNRVRIQQRVLDVIHLWLEGFYSVDFECNHEVIELLHAFLQLNEIKSLKEGEDLLELLTNCEEGHSVDLISVKAEEDVHIYKAAAPKKWGSLKSLFRGKSSSPKPLSVCAGDKTGPMKANHDDVYFPKTARRTDAFALADYTPQCLAEQLTLIAQSIFHLTHPVHYLNSKAHGVSVALTMPGNRGFQRQMSSQEETIQSLFVGGDIQDNPIQTLIDHTQELSYWTAAEIVGCGSSKGQVAVLSKFLYTAQICKEMRNYGTCLAIMDGLENLIVKQLPAWKHLPAKCLAIVEELNAVRMFLKNDDMSALSTSDSHLLPTIPPVLLFLLHVQQQEIGSFQLANEMFKWIKMRSITKVIDQIRIFKDHVYGFDPDFELQETLHMRIQELSRQDLHVIASQHDSNFQKIPSAGGIGAAFRKMKGKLQNK